MELNPSRITTPEKHIVTLGGQKVAYSLRRSEKARYARLEVGSEGGLTVVVPASWFGDRVRRLLQEKRRWITAKLDKYGHTDSGTHHRLKTGDTLLYLGRDMMIETEESEDKAGNVSLGRQSLVVSIAPGHDILHLVLEKWYRTEAQNKIRPMVDELSYRMGLSHNRVTLKSHRSLWGSCSRKRNLNFNWRLIMTPEPVIQYVIIHELAHLKEMNHSPRFWQIVESYCPAWREHRKWLREHSQSLGQILPG